MTVLPAGPARAPIGRFTIVAVGILVAGVTVLGLTFVRPVLLYLALGGLAVVMPTLVIREPKAYWLFLLVLSVPIDIAKRSTVWLIDPRILLSQFGPGTISLDFYLTDMVLIAMLLPWLAQLSLRQTTFCFPKIGYVFVIYISWALIISLANSVSLYMSMFEWCRQILYFIAFLYLINNVVTRSHFRAIVLALFVGLVIHSAIVISFFYLGKGTETNLFSGLYRERERDLSADTGAGTTILHAGQSGEGASTKRASGTFAHPAQAAYYFDFILPIVFAFLLKARLALYRILCGGVMAVGCVALYLTFSRAGLVGLLAATMSFFLVGRWARLIGRRVFTWCSFLFVAAAALGAPLLIRFIEYRPEATAVRLDMLKAVLKLFWQSPMLPTLGSGLSNSTAVMQSLRGLLTVGHHPAREYLAIHNHYLAVLTDVGLIGFILFFTFFGGILAIGLRSARTADTEMAAFLVGMIASLVGIATFNLADTFLGHVTYGMLWLYAGLIVAAARQVQAGRPLPTRAPIATRTVASSPGAALAQGRQA